VRRELHELLAELDIPTLFVTHDFEDAAALAGRVGVLVDGRLRQIGSTEELVARPADPFVAAFTGANLLHGTVAGLSNGIARVRLEDGTVISTTEPATGDVVVAVYPWDVVVGREPPHDSALNVIHAPIRSITELGNRVRLGVGPLSAEITSESLRRLQLSTGQVVYASFKATGTRVLSRVMQ
jgi:molybdate transport system ATP-binding protein